MQHELKQMPVYDFPCVSIYIDFLFLINQLQISIYYFTSDSLIYSVR